MGQGSFDYVDHENAKVVTDLLLKTDKVETSAVAVTNSVRHFLKTDQFNIKVGDVSVANAEKQMKAVAAIFNDKRDLLLDTERDIAEQCKVIEELREKVESSGHATRVTKLNEAIAQIQFYNEPITDLVEQLNSSKKKHLESLKARILKSERVRHFKKLK
jgi:hypothetical protein